ncbi:hypothetical protein ACQ4LE_008180 [Meloidogyne hapla]
MFFTFQFFVIALIFTSTSSRRRTSSKNRQFEARPGMGGLVLEEAVEDKDNEVAKESELKPVLGNISRGTFKNDAIDIMQKSTYETVDEAVNGEMMQVKKLEEDIAFKILDSAVNVTDDAQELYIEDKEMPRNLSILPEAVGKRVFWIDATFKAVDLDLNISSVPECITWQRFWKAKDNSSNIETFRLLKVGNQTDDGRSPNELVEYEVLERGDRILSLIPSSVADELFDNEGFEAIGILWQEICGEHERDFLYTSPEDARAIGVDNDSIICEPFRKELHPDISTLIDLEKRLTKLIGWNYNFEDNKGKNNTMNDARKKIRTRQVVEKNGDKIVKTEEEMEENIRNRTESATDARSRKPVEVDISDETSPLLVFSSATISYALGLKIAPRLYYRHQRVGLALQGICSDYVPTAIEAFNASEFEGIEIEGPIGVNISALESAGVNLTELAEKLRNDTEVDDILSRTKDLDKQVGGSFILPVLTKNQYDPFSPPIVFQGSAVVVRFGIYIESISNFQTSTM